MISLTNTFLRSLFKKSIYIIPALLFLAAGQPLFGQDITYYVASDGSDQNPDTKEQPFGSWQKAKEMVQNIDRETKVTVYFRGGKNGFMG